ncbi:hypothetical protein RBU49_08575 [Clostridium sp. MB40-C1]|uniref:hypothetical protein n=1 Tax=Clostridium sp. MB40-C1 TaxID=3070996 RepID=UPI0027E1A3C6|nr:hypothetical protein [Clostridium sp. MB40-C1]WMJ82287.1 hypothetical protein RBU49_08575 [Clostridium sp. MB40-C1]
MPKLTVTLKQHSPLIHFQGNQSGAILRASEVKPKLDKFLRKHVFEGGFEEYKQYLIGYDDTKKEEDFKEKEAFDYKLRIITDISKIRKLDIRGSIKSLYFANMGSQNESEEKDEIISVFTDDDVVLEFFTLHEKLKDKINENIEFFLAINNFGTRQSKGFGSFYVKNPKNEINKSIEKACMCNGINKYLSIQYNKEKYPDIMQDISIIYPLMKSGLNYPDHPREFDSKTGKKKINFNKKLKNQSYHKGFLFRYMLDKNIGNEKRFIKENFFKINDRIKNDGKPKKYVRAMLGICDGVDFKEYSRNGKIRYVSDIDRFQSPILFKIIENKLFIIPKKIPEEMFNKRFEFSNTHLIRGEKKTDKKTIYTPRCDQFNLEDFLCEFAEYFNNRLEESKINNLFEKKLRRAKTRKIQIRQVVK